MKRRVAGLLRSVWLRVMLGTDMGGCLHRSGHGARRGGLLNANHLKNVLLVQSGKNIGDMF